MSEDSLDEDTKAEKVNSVTLDGAAIEDLGMTMEYSPSSRWEQSRMLMMAQFG